MTHASTGNGHFVGNGGDGYVINGSVILRDLIEQGSAQTPWVGSEIDSDLKNALIGTQLEDLLGENSDLFIRKITDLNHVSPFLGEMILDALNVYDIFLTDEELGLLPEDGKIFDALYTRVQIANRFKNTIRISKSRWQKMDSINKIALLIHEGFFSITPISCFPQLAALCAQMPNSARETTGMVFKKFWLNPGKKLNLSWLNLPEIQPLSESCQGRPRLEVKIKPFKNPPPFSPHPLTTFLTFAPQIEQARISVIEKACSHLSTEPEKIAFVNIVRKPYKIKKYEYYAYSGNQPWLQVAIKLESQSAAQSFATTSQSCKNQIKNMSERWFVKNINIPQTTVCY